MTGCLFMEFDDNKGINCEQCKLKANNGNYSYCIVMGDESRCSENWCRKNCPLLKISSLNLIDKNDELCKEVLEHGESIVYSCNKSGYKQILRGKKETKLLETIKRIEEKINMIQNVYEVLSQKREACEELLDIERNKN